MTTAPIDAQSGNFYPRDFLSFATFSYLLIILAGVLTEAFAQDGLSIKRVPVSSSTFDYVAVGELAEYLNLRAFYSSKARKVVLYVGDAEVKVTAMNPFVQINDHLVQMPLETQYADDDILVPLWFFAGLLKPLYPGTWPSSLSAPSSKFAVASEAPKVTQIAELISPPELFPAPPPSSEPEIVKIAPLPNITGISASDKANGTLITIKTTQTFDRKHITSRFSQGWLYVDIVGGRVASDAVAAITPGGLIKNISPVQTGAMAQLSFQLNREVDSKLVTISRQPAEILVSIPTQEFIPTSVLKNLETERQKWQIDTIVLDPGHGGRDPGAIGSQGGREKDITLQVCRRLKKVLEDDLNVRVILTRERDEFIKLDQRTSMANAAQGKLFISVHCNANTSRRVRGASTYFLGPAKTDEALEVALRENSVIKYEGVTDAESSSEEEFILMAMAQNEFNRESQELAAIVQEHLQGSVGLVDRGVHQAGFRVLIGASMPSILIELAFISNKNEEQLLRSAETQDKMVKAISASIKRFKNKYEWGS